MKQIVNYDVFLVSAWIPKAMYFQLLYMELCKLQEAVIRPHTGGCVSNSGQPVHQ
jgi:hypothetical protein